MKPSTEETVERLERRIQRIQSLITVKRRPLFIEFSGTPKSGKTTTLSAVHQFLKRNKVVVRTLQERASIAPLIDKGTAFFNIWVTCSTLNGMIEALEEEKLDVLILDRGLFDGLVWIDWQERTHRISHPDAATFRRFILSPRWRDLVDVLFVMHCTASTSLEREQAKQITFRHGSIMNKGTLAQLRGHYLEAANRYKQNFRNLHVLDSTKGDEMRLITKVAKYVLGVYETLADEEVLCLPRKIVSLEIAASEKKILRPDWADFRKTINRKGSYIRRSKAESSDRWIQIVPVCVIRHKGKILTNTRHEPGESLHDTMANWAGGHVRKQDLSRTRTKWDSVVRGLRRELREELALEEIAAPTPIGLVHSGEDARAARHLGVVFQIDISDPSMLEAFTQKTIRERPNRFVTTNWMTRDELSANMQGQRDWSRAISTFLGRERTA